MRVKAVKMEIINHGIEHSQYFQGCGTSFSVFNICYTGAGSNAKEAYEDAVEQCYQSEIDSKSLDRILPTKPKGIRVRDKVPAKFQKEELNEIYWYVSIRLKLQEII